MEPFGKFELLAPLAMGGMAELFIARHRGLANVERLVVVKRILPHLAGQAQFVDMFLEEARIAALLDHPNIVPIYDLGHVEGSYFIAMPYVAGITARQVLQETKERGEKIPAEVICAVLLQVLSGLGYAHQRQRLDGTPLNIVHRDISPSNVMLEQTGRALLLDFGIAKAADKAQRETETGSIKGKLTYMSPEQCQGDVLDQRSDIFSTGIVFHELVTCERLFKRKTDMLVFKAIVEEPIPDPRELRPGLPAPLAEVINRALAREPRGRFASAEQMREAVRVAMREAGVPDGGTQIVADYLAEHFGEELAQRRQLLLEARASVARKVSPSEETRTSAPPGFATSSGVVDQPAPRPRRRLALLLTAVALLLAACGVGLYLWIDSDGRPGGDPLRLGVAPYLPADVLKRELGPLARYLERELDRPVDLVVPDSYGRTVEMLLSGELHLADLPPYPYLLAHRRNPKVQMLAMVVAAGSASYEGYLVVRRSDEGMTDIAGLAGMRVCYVDKTSTSGYLVPRVMVRKVGRDPDKHFASAQFSGNHYQALRDLLAGRCDVAAVYSGAYLSAAAHGVAVGRTRILAVSGQLPDDAIVAAPDLPPAEARAVRRALLELNMVKEIGRRTLGPSVFITGFVPPRPAEFADLEREIRK